MSTRPWTLLCGLIFCAWIASQIVSPLLARQDAAGSSPETPSVSAEERELNIRYAQAHLKAMEARLAEFDERNRRFPKTMRPAAVQLAQEYVDKARLRLEAVKSETPNDSQFYVVRAEADLRGAEQNLSRAETVNRGKPNAIIPGEIARLTAQRDLARVRLEKARHLAAESPLSNIRFEIEQLREEAQELRMLQTMAARGG